MNIDTPLPSQLPALRDLWKEAFGDTEDFISTFFSTAFHTERCRCVTINHKVVAALYWFDCLYRNSHIAYLYAVATHTSYRGQSICHTLMQDTHLQLVQLGYEGSILVPGNKELFAFYQGMGYRTCSHVDIFYCESCQESIPLRRINTSEYAALRRQFLPADSVIQEQENLDFLETRCSFYAGDHFLLAAYYESDTLHGVELLGDKSRAPQILHTLNLTKGCLRTPGYTHPFAMYIPLGNNNFPPPNYFGLAFD